MMTHLKENHILKDFFKNIYLSHIPNKRDNLKQALIKLIFILCIIALLSSAYCLADYFWEAEHQNSIIAYSQEIWHKAPEGSNKLSLKEKEALRKEKIDLMLSENKDFKGWITIGGTQIDNPIYQTDNNNYYLNHNQLRQKSDCGALYFDYRNKISDKVTDKNLIIYGHEMENSSMFGSLKRLRSLDFYKLHPIIKFSTLYLDSTYKIYSIFILNSDKADDDGYIYNIYQQGFNEERDFYYWVNEAKDRSIINTGVDVEYDDEILTLITNSSDFPNSRLVVMARKVRDGEPTKFDTSNCTVNSNPRYPKKWYEHRGIKYPF